MPLASQITNYQCQNCTGPLHFDGASGQLVCDYCGTRYDVDVIEQIYADKEQAAVSAGSEPDWKAAASGGGWNPEEAARLRTYSCPTCSAELICDETTAATACPYCGNPSVVPGQLTGGLRPDFVLPFRLDRDTAVKALQSYYKGKKFLPKSFMEQNHIQEIKGVYVPFWLFDGQAEASLRFHGTRVHVHRRGDEEITVTEHYRVSREGTLAFEKVPADASTKMPDAHMDAVEPFHYGELKPFSTAYLPGFLANKYDVDLETCAQRANRRIRQSTEDAFAATAGGYSSLTPEYADIRLTRGRVGYALMPVWMLSTKWQGKDFLFAMNGQTGKLVGDLPVDPGRFWAWFAGISLPLMAILGALMFLGGGIL